MSEFDEEVYSTMFNALRHGVRRNILRMLGGGELSFTTIAEGLNRSSSHLTYHLDSLKELVSKEDGGYYQQAIRMVTLELNALVEGALVGGATEVYAWPGHGAFPGGIDV